MTLVAFNDIGGNPFPSSLWTAESGPINGDRFITNVPGQLTIKSLQLNDSGNYTNNLTNTAVFSLLNVLELFVVG